MPVRRSFFKSLLSRKVALWVQRTHRNAAEVQLVEELADAAFMQRNRKFVCDAISQIATAPAHNTIFRQVRAILNPARQVSHLHSGQTGCGAGPKAIRQPAIENDFDIEKISTPMSFAPRACKKLGAWYSSKVRSAYAKS